jgi:hypothetical protein
MSHKNGGPAFPVIGTNLLSAGMSLRDYLAAKALTERGSTFSLAGLTQSEALSVALGAYAMADAMLEARDR